jgi:hypothetical protein
MLSFTSVLSNSVPVKPVSVTSAPLSSPKSHGHQGNVQSLAVADNANSALEQHWCNIATGQASVDINRKKPSVLPGDTSGSKPVTKTVQKNMKANEVLEKPKNSVVIFRRKSSADDPNYCVGDDDFIVLDMDDEDADRNSVLVLRSNTAAQQAGLNKGVVQNVMPPVHSPRILTGSVQQTRPKPIVTQSQPAAGGSMSNQPSAAGRSENDASAPPVRIFTSTAAALTLSNGSTVASSDLVDQKPVGLGAGSVEDDDCVIILDSPQREEAPSQPPPSSSEDASDIVIIEAVSLKDMLPSSETISLKDLWSNDVKTEDPADSQTSVQLSGKQILVV